MNFLWIYLGVVVALVIVYLVFNTHRKRISRTLIAQIDTLIYLFDKHVYEHKQAIFDYDATKSLLFHNQQQFFQRWKNYAELMPLILKDIEYVSTLIHKQIISQEDMNSLTEIYHTEQKLYTLKHYTHTILIILTLWIAKLFLP